MLPLIMAACGAAGAVAGVLTTQAANEKDRQAIERYEKVNAELINSRDKLQQRYYELSDKSQSQIKDLNLKLAESEMEKDLVYLALSLYHELMALREDIDINPCFEVLVEFHKAIVLTNDVLQQLDKSLVPVTQDYFSRTLTRIGERDNLSKEQLFNFMAVLINPQQDTITSLIGDVQNEMFSQPYTKVKEHNDSFDKTIDIKPDNDADMSVYLCLTIIAFVLIYFLVIAPMSIKLLILTMTIIIIGTIFNDVVEFATISFLTIIAFVLIYFLVIASMSTKLLILTMTIMIIGAMYLVNKFYEIE